MTQPGQQSDPNQEPDPANEALPTAQSAAPKKGMSTGKLLVIVGAPLLAVVCVVTTIIVIDTVKSSSGPNAGAASTGQPECAAVTAAYNKWHGDLGPITAGYKMPTGDDLDHLAANGKHFLTVVKEHSDESSKNLAYAIGTYDDALAHAHVVLTNSGSIDNDTFMSILNQGVEINNTYHAFQAAVCGSPSTAATSN